MEAGQGMMLDPFTSVSEKTDHHVKFPFIICLFCLQDLEEQSRLIAASSRPANPTGADGQFLTLSNSQSEDSDAGDEGKKRGESEA